MRNNDANHKTQIEQRSHVVIAGPGQWGQQAVDHLLHRVVAHGGRITVIVPRRSEDQFRTYPPSYRAWSHYKSVQACLDDLRKGGKKPVHYLYDDQFSHLAAELIQQRRSREYLTAGYVTSGVESHYAYARFLSRFCDRVLVEKPVSKIRDEVKPKIRDEVKPSEGKFIQLAQEAEKMGCMLLTADHFLFRPGVQQACYATANLGLSDFLLRHKGCDLRYEFRFCEADVRDDPMSRLAAYHDGAILDVLIPHGLGPLVRLVLPVLLGGKTAFDWCQDLDTHIELHNLKTWRGTQPDNRLHVPTLAETAGVFYGSLELPTELPTVKRKLDIHLCSVKGDDSNDRYFRIVCPLETCKHYRDDTGAKERAERQLDLILSKNDHPPQACFYGVSLGAAGFTVVDHVRGVLYVERESGHRSDKTGGGSFEPAIAQAAMLTLLITVFGPIPLRRTPRIRKGGP